MVDEVKIEGIASAYWKLVRRRRNQLWLAWPAWLVVGPVLFGFWSVIFGLFDATASRAGAGIGFSLATYVVLIYLVPLRRIWAIKCFNCGKQAIFSPFFFMKDARCQHCGIRAADSPQLPDRETGSTSA